MTAETDSKKSASRAKEDHAGQWLDLKRNTVKWERKKCAVAAVSG
jgi:hypothetical protein